MDYPLRPMLVAGALFMTGSVAVGMAGAAHAETAPQLNLALPDFAGVAPAPQAVVTAAGAPAKPTPDLADPLDPQTRPKLVVNPLDSEVFAKTSVDHHFSKGDGGATASAGFLCGLQPGHATSGGVAAYGVDPHGRFVGAKLSFAF
ncbi:MAG: hypothetical protein JSS35_04995 [Proteobacteria bacterium]|nr:hypothetical protein [Pseudomonadota bacterium]